NGGKYYMDGKEMDCIELLKKGGFNIVRLRLYNDPGNPDFSPSCRLPRGIEDEADILSLAARSKAAGMQIELTFHYSDYWTNGRDQTKPHEWENLDFDGLKKAVYDYTYQVMKDMAAQGTSPEYVSLGNETQSGMLYPDGAADKMEQLCELYKAGAKAVRDADPASKIIIHLAGGSVEHFVRYFEQLERYGVEYEVIGTSYYPNSSTRDVAWLMAFSDSVLTRFPGKEMMVMETGYSWNPTLPSGRPGQLRNNGPYPDLTPEGQKAFMEEMIAGIRADERILGVLYWDPIFIEVPGIGWELGGPNVVSNTTLFDFEGNALPVFEAFRQ
ncbi:MAG: arabinogalactan endo-1,4-beta-galactosidase, partial [Bacteroidales bacterium]|nr:arabinogalactan endo-1,4-beta-galactosidase [Bacteroidales bacterium]